jgi:FMN phosphatase YigB (HAD superfamily)
MEPIEKIKAVVFDLGGVYFTHGTILAIDKLKDYYGLQKRIFELHKFFRDFPNSEGYQVRLGKISIKEFEARFYSKFKIENPNEDSLEHIWFGSYVPNYGMKDLVVFSGNIKERIEYLDKRYDFLKYFNDLVFSYEYGKNKNDIEFYHELTKHINCEPNEAIFIDDELKNVSIAHSLGFKCINYVYTEKLLSDLNSYGISINLKLKKP